MASTATQVKAKDNSFWVLKLHNGSVINQRYYFDGNTFVPGNQITKTIFKKAPFKP
jgi:hypothetical protein